MKRLPTPFSELALLMRPADDNRPFWDRHAFRTGTVAAFAVLAGGVLGFFGILMFLDSWISTGPRKPISQESVSSQEFAAGADGTKLLGPGWSHPEKFGTWSDGPRAEIAWKLETTPVSDVDVRVEARPFPVTASIMQSVEVSVNGTRVATLKLNPEGEFRGGAFSVPLHVALTQNPLRFVFEIARPTSPSDLRVGNDTRKLGIGLKSITVQYRTVLAALRSRIPGDVAEWVANPRPGIARSRWPE